MNAAEVNNKVNNMVDESVKELYTIIDKARTCMLQKEYFDQCIVVYQTKAFQLIQMITTPAIVIRDVEGKVHYVVASEKWKIMMTGMYFYSEKGNEGQRTLNCTNPIDLKYDSFVVDKDGCKKAMQDYEELYDANIQIVMDINNKVMGIASLNTNSEKLDVLKEVTDMIKRGIERNKEVYEIVKSGN